MLNGLIDGVFTNIIYNHFHIIHGVQILAIITCCDLTTFIYKSKSVIFDLDTCID